MKQYQAEARVWPVSQGEGVIVSVVDSGVMEDHQDLAGQVLPGADFSGAKTDGRVDGEGHGTGIASLIAGHGHGTGSGVMGLAPKAKILPIRIRAAGEHPELRQSDIELAVRYAVDHGAKVVNLSVGGYDPLDSAARQAILYAVSKDVVVVAATGNSGDSGAPVEYPAAFPGVVAVGAVGENGSLWARSTSGPETTLVAPGTAIYQATAKSTSGYGVGDGTSDAAAYVSATAALIRAAYPGLSAGQVINRMITTATAPADGGAVPNGRYGYGILAPAKALEANPAVDNGPRDNPLLHRVESQATDEPTGTPAPVVPQAGGAGGWYGVVWGVLGGGVLLVAGVGVWVGRRVRRR
ncbi:S8 family serine peptidase [Kitasatospora sp. NPDC093558]|uniref:S8 family serine peptidase n=1 Tax=Kitasatospora sp. NPDC093558 TaxID=3155201 RepID=UPI00344136E0